jgi:hypothetical protein
MLWNLNGYFVPNGLLDHSEVNLVLDFSDFAKIGEYLPRDFFRLNRLTRGPVFLANVQFDLGRENFLVILFDPIVCRHESIPSIFFGEFVKIGLPNTDNVIESG